MAFVLTNIGTHGAAGATNSVTGTAVPAGATIIVVVDDASNSAVGGSVADDVGNTYTPITGKTNNNANTNGFGRAFYAHDVLALTSAQNITYSVAVGTGPSQVSACYLTGMVTGADPLDSAVTANASGSSTSPSVTSGTPGQSGEFFIGVVSDTGTSADTFTQDTNHAWATPPNRAAGAGSGSVVQGGSFLNTGSSALTYAPTITTHPWAAFIFAFKPADILFAQSVM